MNFFDLHCDTMLRLLDGSSLADADAHLNLSKAQPFEKWAQVFALFVLDNTPGRDAAYDAYRRLYAGFIRQMRLYADRPGRPESTRHCSRWRTGRCWAGASSALPSCSGMGCVC